MKNIFYCSNAQGEMFPQNTRSKFDNYIDINHLSYLPSHDIEAAIVQLGPKLNTKLALDHPPPPDHPPGTFQRVQGIVGG